MRYRFVPLSSILITITCLSLSVAVAGPSPTSHQDPPLELDRELFERQQEMMQAMQDRLEERMQKEISRERSGLSREARPEQSACGIAVQMPSRQESDSSGFRPGVGLRIKKVLPRSPAAKATLRPGDLIESIQGQWIFNRDQLVALIRCFPPGEEIRIKGVRDGRPFEKTCRLVRSDALTRSSRSSDSERGYDFQRASDSAHGFASDFDSDHGSSSSSSSSSDSDHGSSSSSSSSSDSDRSSSSSSSSDVGGSSGIR